jgi:Ca-activated chloride channel family protein
VAQAKKINLSIDILAIGKPTSVPINIPNAGLLKDAEGNQVIVKLDLNNLRQAAGSLNGNLILVTKDNRDTQALLQNWQAVADNYQQDQEQKLDIWQEEGVWLLLLLVPLCAIFFRRGLLLVFIFYLELPHIPTAYAQENSTVPMSNIWKSYSQQGIEKYQAGDYEAAAKFFAQEQNDIGRYNYANSLIHLQQYTQALEIYSKLLETLGTESTLYQDTLHNHQLVADFLNNQKNNNNQKNDNQDSQKDNNQNNQKDNNQDNQNNNNGHQENSGDQSQEANQQNSQKGNNKDNQKSNNQQQNQNPSDDSNAQEMSQQNNQKDNKDDQKNENQIAAKQADTAADKPEDTENQSLGTTTANKLEQLTPEQAQELQQWLNQIPQQQNHDLLQSKFQQQYNRKRQ